MKKVFLALMAALACCGSVSAYESHWPDFDQYSFDKNSPFVAAIAINGTIITSSDANWDALEVAFFVGDECRGNENYLCNDYVVEYGDPFPVLDGVPIYYTNGGETVSFRMYDHLNNVEYDQCEITLEGKVKEILTGTDYLEGWDDPENPVILNFTFSGPQDVYLTAKSDGTSYWATYYNSSSDYIAVENTTVYSAALNQDKTKLTLTEVEYGQIPAGCAVILKSTAEEIELSPLGTILTTLENNDLEGVDEETEQDGNYAYYVLGMTDGNGFGFHILSADKKLGAHKAFLKFELNSRSFLGFEEETTSVSDELKSQEAVGEAWFTLDGRKLQGQPATKGIYVRNGQKMIGK